MMRYIVILFLSCFFSSLNAEERKDDRLKYHTTLEEALKEASKKNKPVFFNCYADWSGACHLMDSVVLADPQLVSFIKKRCVPLRVDMVSTVEGRQLADKYQVKYFAHFLILDSKGDVIHRIVGGAKAPEFLESLKRGLNPKTSLRGMNNRYDKGNRDLQFLIEYADVLDEADETEKFSEVAEYYLKHVNPEQLYDKRSWKMLSKKGMKYGSEWFSFIYEHRNELIQENGQEVTEFLVQSAFQKLFPYMVFDKNSDINLFQEMKQKLESLDPAYEPRQQLMDICQILILRQEKKYAEMLGIWEKCMANFPNSMVEWKFDMTLGQLQDMDEVEKKQAVAYLSAKLSQMPAGGKKRNQYQNTIDQLTSYQGIVFETGTFNEALEKAKREGKALFVDCYTSWCGPCHMMSKRVFPQKAAGDFMNPSFVCIKIDMEKGEGIELAKRWKVNSFPTYLVLNAQGEVVYSSKGAMPVETFVKQMEEGLAIWKKSVNK